MNKSLKQCFVMFILILAIIKIPSVALGQSSDYKKERISLEVKEQRIDKVLEQISKLARVYFFFSDSKLDTTQLVTCNLKNTELEQVIAYVLGRQNVQIVYQKNRTIVLKPNVAIPKGVSVQKIRGTVIDAKTGESLVGASIVLKERPSMGVVTDLEGKFFFEFPVGMTGLIVSYVGYETKEIKIDNSISELNIKLSPVVQEMEGVVITGMAPRKVEGFTGDYVTVKGEQLKHINPNNILKALQLFDPSFRIVENNDRGSDPNAMPLFQMRGDVQIGDFQDSQLSMLLGDYSNRPNMPLFILDGFEANLQRIVDLDPERVESVTILKDASATAIYGSRAANGVVVFETKRPNSGRLNIGYSMNVGITVPDLTDYNLMTAKEKLQFEYDAGLFSEQNASQMNYYNHYLREIESGVNTYWLSVPLRTAVAHRHSLSIDGGVEELRYSLNLNYNANPGVMKESDRNTVGMGLNLIYRRGKWNVNNSLALSNTVGHNTPYGSFSEYTRLNPYYRKFDENGQLVSVIDRKNLGAGISQLVVKNPLYNTQFPYKDMQTNFFVNDNVTIEYSPIENLRFNIEGTFTKSTANSQLFKSKSHTDFAFESDLTKQGSFAKNTGESFSWNIGTSVNYNFVRGANLLSIFGRWEANASENDGVNLSAKGFPNDNMNDFLFAYEMDDRVRGSANKDRSIGVIGQISYMYDQRYSIDFSVRGDMSSQFGPNPSLKPFWAVGMRWNISRETWLIGSWVSNLVIRGNIGVTGAQNYSAYEALETYNFDDLMFPYLSSDVLGAQLMGFGNKDLDWSTTKNRSFALELGLFNNRITGSFNYYNNYTDQLLLDYSLAPSSGFPTVKTNAGSIVNEGYDATLGVMVVQNYERQVQWNININASHNRNEIKKISNVVKAMNEANLNRKDAPVPIYEEGKSRSQLFAVPSLGIDPATGKEVFLKQDGSKTYTWNPADKIAFGDTEPKLRGAVSTSFTYRNLSISLGGAYQLGMYRYNSTLVDKIENANIGYNVDKRAAKDRWRKPGDVAKYKSITSIGHSTEASSRFIQKVNEFNFSNISMGYRLNPKKVDFLERCHISTFSINASMVDIATFSNIERERGLSYPYARSFNLSLSVLFN